MGRDKKKPIDWISFVNNTCPNEVTPYIMKACEILVEKNNLIELDKQKSVNIDELLRLMEEECDRGTKLFAIDHLHYFEMLDSKERHDIQIQNVMHKLNEIARNKNISIILVAHYRK
jgi:predicted ATP-dependent serine protease